MPLYPPAAAAEGGGLATGTSFPVSPTTGDRYRRSDIDYMTFVYDGADWVSEEVRYANWFYRLNAVASGTYEGTTVPNPFGANGVRVKAKMTVSGLINGSVDESNYWTIAQRRYDGAWVDMPTPAVITINDAPSGLVGFTRESAWTAIPDVAEMGLKWTKVGTPGGLFGACGMAFRRIAT